MKVCDDIGMLFQESALFDSLTVAENVGYKLSEETDMPLDEVRRRVEDDLGFIGLSGSIDKMPFSISDVWRGGQGAETAGVGSDTRCARGGGRLENRLAGAIGVEIKSSAGNRRVHSARVAPTDRRTLVAPASRGQGLERPASIAQQQRRQGEIDACADPGVWPAGHAQEQRR